MFYVHLDKHFKSEKGSVLTTHLYILLNINQIVSLTLTVCLLYLGIFSKLCCQNLTHFTYFPAFIYIIMLLCFVTKKLIFSRYNRLYSVLITLLSKVQKVYLQYLHFKLVIDFFF